MKFLAGPSVFYAPNFERNLTRFRRIKYHRCSNDVIGTESFVANQCDLNVVWHIIEGQMFASVELNTSLKNMRYFIEQSGIDLTSSVELIFNVFTQLMEENCALVLAPLVRFVDFCESREQFRWLKNAMLKLQEAVHMDNAVCHAVSATICISIERVNQLNASVIFQHIIYALCKSSAILVPSTSEINHLCNLLSDYLKSNHLFIRLAALRGLLCLLESMAKTNTTIGGPSEDILVLRTLIINYVNKNGIFDKR